MTVALRWWRFRKCEVLCRTGANRFNTTSPQTDTLSHALTTGRVTQKTLKNSVGLFTTHSGDSTITEGVVLLSIVQPDKQLFHEFVLILFSLTERFM